MWLDIITNLCRWHEPLPPYQLPLWLPFVAGRSWLVIAWGNSLGQSLSFQKRLVMTFTQLKSSTDFPDLLVIFPLNRLATLFETLDSHSLKISVLCRILKWPAANHLNYLALLVVPPKSFTSLLLLNPSTVHLFTPYLSMVLSSQALQVAGIWRIFSSSPNFYLIKLTPLFYSRKLISMFSYTTPDLLLFFTSLISHPISFLKMSLMVRLPRFANIVPPFSLFN